MATIVVAAIAFNPTIAIPTLVYAGISPIAVCPDLTQQGSDVNTGMLGKGIGQVRGTIKEKGAPDAPVKRRVRLLRDRDSMRIRETWSDAITGNYEFLRVDELQTYTVISYDHTLNYRAVVADRVTPEIMP